MDVAIVMCQELLRTITFNMPIPVHTLISYFGKAQFHNMYDSAKTVIECKLPRNKNRKVAHIKPGILAEFFITHYTNDGDLIYDLFSGSFETYITCKKLNRRSVSIELNAALVDLIIYNEIIAGEKTIKKNNKKMNIDEFKKDYENILSKLEKKKNIDRQLITTI